MSDTGTVQDRIEHFKNRGIAALVDLTATPQRGILLARAENIDPSTVNSMVTLGKGNIFAAVSAQRARELLLEDMAALSTRHPSPPHSLAQASISVEAREGVTTGISASDRAMTLRVLGDPRPHPGRLVKPGHVFPIRTKEGGALVKFALPEGAHDLVRLTYDSDGAAFIDLLNDAGEFCAFPEVEEICKRHKLPLVTLDELVRYRLENELLVKRVAEAKLPTAVAGELRSYLYQSLIFEGEHLALVKGNLPSQEPVLTRVQSEFTFGDVFGGSNPPSRSQLQEALHQIGSAERGVLLYLRRSEPGSLTAQIEDWNTAYKRPTATAMKEYGIGAQILRDLGVRKIALLTGSTRKLEGLSPFGIEIVKQIPLQKDNQTQEDSRT
ncbi:MAG: 3,4-dihydroxy-2-butanone-4-phosphate synthase [Bdellovibrionales bacterium]|nr:3,4-dihydroxy-2-butanone-4-phosphate synthase [Bdellovibrionales bacterium]